MPNPSIFSGKKRRMYLAVLFTDIKGSTPANQELGDRKWGILRDEHFEIIRACVVNNDGEVAKTVGDSVISVFVAASSAARCALDIQTRMASFNQSRPGQTPLQVRIGINAGEVDVQRQPHLDVFGTEVNVAARVEGLASGQDILLTKPIKDAVDALRPEWFHSVMWECIGLRPIKGMPNPIEVWKVSPSRRTACAAQAT